MNKGCRIIEGENFKAIMCGGEVTDHECNSDEMVLITESGERIYWHTFPQWASHTYSFRNMLIYQHQIEINDPVLGASVYCSICQRAAIDDLPYF